MLCKYDFSGSDAEQGEIDGISRENITTHVNNKSM